jgi:predicted dehydrogenase
MLKIALIGCGKIADQHAQAIARTAESRLVAVCDHEILMARQLAERFGHPACFSDVATMLCEASPQVVHITTPPQSHFSLAKQCLQSGCHVYLEKPFTVTAAEAEDLIRLAEGSNLCLTAGHNLQFTLEMLELRRLVEAGFLGGKPNHLESHFTYGLGDTSYVGALLGSREHWVRRLPGQLFHNIISHGIAKLAEFLDDGPVEVVARAHQSAELAALGGSEVLDELRVLLRDRSGTTAFFCFSTQLRPALNLLRVCGPRGSLVVDHASGTLIRQDNRADKSYLTFFLPPLRLAAQHFRNACRNMISFLRQRLYQDSGLKELIGRFHASIRTGGAPPIVYREILLTARIMDDIFAQVYPVPTVAEEVVVPRS